MSRRLAKLSGEKRLDQVPRDGWSHSPDAHANNIHVIVFDTLPRRKMVVNQGSPHTRNFVGAHRRAHAAPANRHSSFYILSSYCLRQSDDEVWIVIAFIQSIGTEIDDLVSRFAESPYHLFL